MQVLVLGPTPSPVTPILTRHGCVVLEREDRIDAPFVREQTPYFAVSYRYRHIVREEVLEELGGKIINLHISLLPWNRGADPNLWSFLDDTPKGVTIHYMDAGIDTGDIIAQRELRGTSWSGQTLATTYAALEREILDLFDEIWPRIVDGQADRKPQLPGGTHHRAKDRDRFSHLLAKQGWDTLVAQLIGQASQSAKG